MTTYKKIKDLIILTINGQEHKLWGLCIGAYSKRITQLKQYIDMDYIDSLLVQLNNPSTNTQASDALLWLNEFIYGHYQDFYKGNMIEWSKEQKKWNSANSHALRRDVMNNSFRGTLSDDSTKTYAKLADEKLEATNRKKALANKRKSKLSQR